MTSGVNIPREEKEGLGVAASPSLAGLRPQPASRSSQGSIANAQRGPLAHSPGPFRYRREKWPSSPAWVVESEQACINGLRAWFVLAYLYIDKDAAMMTEGSLNPEADAALFAAAPDLLAAAKRALTTLKAQGESVRPGNVLGALDAAITKAEGR